MCRQAVQTDMKLSDVGKSAMSNARQMVSVWKSLTSEGVSVVE